MGGFVGEDVDGPRRNNINDASTSSPPQSQSLRGDHTTEGGNEQKGCVGSGEEKGCVYCLDAHNGSIRWCCPLPGEVKSAPLFVHSRRDTVVAGTQGEWINTIDETCNLM